MAKGRSDEKKVNFAQAFEEAVDRWEQKFPKPRGRKRKRTELLRQIERETNIDKGTLLRYLKGMEPSLTNAYLLAKELDFSLDNLSCNGASTGRIGNSLPLSIQDLLECGEIRGDEIEQVLRKLLLDTVECYCSLPIWRQNSDLLKNVIFTCAYMRAKGKYNSLAPKAAENLKQVILSQIQAMDAIFGFWSVTWNPEEAEAEEIRDRQAREVLEQLKAKFHRRSNLQKESTEIPISDGSQNTDSTLEFDEDEITLDLDLEGFECEPDEPEGEKEDAQQ